MESVGGPCDAGGMDVSAEVLAKVPPQNLHVSREEFGAVWAAAEAQLGRLLPGPEADYLVGVVRTCRWLARAVVPALPLPGQAKRTELATTPLDSRSVYALPETIETEYYNALRIKARTPETARVREAQATAATLGWCWGGATRRPIDLAADGEPAAD